MNITITPRQQAGLEAACAASETSITPEEYLLARVGEVLDGYATAYGIGFITPYEFVERFQKLGAYDAIFALSEKDEHVAGYLAVLRAKTDAVNLYSPTVTQGLSYLVAIGALTLSDALSIQTP